MYPRKAIYILILLMVLVLPIRAAYAATAKVASVWTTDTSNNPKALFNAGETIRIRWSADGTVDILVRFQDSSIDGSWSNKPNTGYVDYNPTRGQGLYMVYCTGAQTVTIAYGTLMVVPELPLGTIGAFLGPLAALAIYRKRRL